MNVSEMFVMILLVSIMIVGMSYFVGDIGTSYGISNVPNVTGLEGSGAINSNVTSFSNSLIRSNQTAQNPVVDAWNYLGFITGSLINSATLLLSTPATLQNMLTSTDVNNPGLLVRVGIPGYVIGVIVTLIIVVIAFAIYRTIAKSDI